MMVYDRSTIKRLYNSNYCNTTEESHTTQGIENREWGSSLRLGILGSPTTSQVFNELGQK